MTKAPGFLVSQPRAAAADVLVVEQNQEHGETTTVPGMWATSFVFCRKYFLQNLESQQMGPSPPFSLVRWSVSRGRGRFPASPFIQQMCRILRHQRVSWWVAPIAPIL